MKIYSNEILGKKNLLISGNHTSGKSLMAAYLKCYKGLGIINKEPAIGAITSLQYSKKINLEVGKQLLNFVINNAIRSNQIGRNINTKISDESSVFNYSEPLTYINSILDLKKQNEKKYNVFDTHNVILSYNLWKKTLNKFYTIQLERHPIDIVESCYRSKSFFYNTNKYKKILIFEKKKKLIPFYLYNIKINNFSNINLTIEVIYQIFKKNYLFYKKLAKDEKKRFLIIDFEKLKSNPKSSLIMIKKSLGLKFNKYLESTMSKETTTKEKIIKRRESNYKKIFKMANKIQMKKLEIISRIYDTKFSKLFLNQK